MDEFVKPTFDNFLTHDDLNCIIKHTKNQKTYDFNTLLGDTIKERYESIYCKLVEANNQLLHLGVKGWFWVVSSPEIISIFETAANGFEPITSDLFDSHQYIVKGVYPQGCYKSKVTYCGSINQKWLLYKDYKLTNEIIIGANDTLESFDNYICIKLENYSI